jgi:hypothetical protein
MTVYDTTSWPTGGARPCRVGPSFRIPKFKTRCRSHSAPARAHELRSPIQTPCPCLRRIYSYHPLQVGPSDGHLSVAGARWVRKELGALARWKTPRREGKKSFPILSHADAVVDPESELSYRGFDSPDSSSPQYFFLRRVTISNLQSERERKASPPLFLNPG